MFFFLVEALLRYFLFFLVKIVFSFSFSWSKSCFFSFFLGQGRAFFLSYSVKIVFSFFFSWSKVCFLSFFLESRVFLDWKRVWFSFFLKPFFHEFPVQFYCASIGSYFEDFQEFLLNTFLEVHSMKSKD